MKHICVLNLHNYRKFGATTSGLVYGFELEAF